MTKLVTIFGGAGFVGRYIARRMAKEGWRVRVATRRPNESLHVKPYGTVGQVEPVLCNIRDDASVRAALLGADAVVNCVGVLSERGKNTFSAVQTEGAKRIATLAAELEIPSLVHLSAIGADAEANSDYARTKGEGEAAILAAFPEAVILRPSVIFGVEDGFFNRFGTMAAKSIVLPIVGGDTKFQPVYVDDVAQAAVKGILGQAEAGVYELGGPDVATLRGHLETMLEEIRRRRLIVDLPFWIGRLMGAGFDVLQGITLGLFHNGILTRDQVKNLAVDNVVGAGSKSFDDLNIAPTSLKSVMPDYMWVYRPHGQFDAIQESAKDMRKA